ncbi:hypothetical protein DERP_001724 [Dermatophagoides pteronyssinus]|uniref:Uncharacterized protein n=1 Tax=Dermatophagoides pteronyssinus TaxID=6956 RepID=A0ABQ8JC03_DERPT|nr:hypothetical protein DERP_001724 [Dermatophagoides pteronyssinus]
MDLSRISFTKKKKQNSISSSFNSTGKQLAGKNPILMRDNNNKNELTLLIFVWKMDLLILLNETKHRQQKLIHRNRQLNFIEIK